MMVNFSTVLNSLRLGEDKNEIIDGLVNYPLLILDDIGMERHTEYALEQIVYQNDIKKRYFRRKQSEYKAATKTVESVAKAQHRLGRLSM